MLNTAIKSLLILFLNVLIFITFITPIHLNFAQAETNTQQESDTSKNNSKNEYNDNSITISPAKIYKRLTKKSGFSEKINLSTNLEINNLTVEILKRESFHSDNYINIKLPNELIKININIDTKIIDIFIDTNKLNNPLSIYKLTILVHTKSTKTDVRTKFEVPIIINITDFNFENNQTIYPKFKLHQINTINLSNKIDYRLEIINPYEYIFLLGGEVIISDNQDKILIKSSIRETSELDFYPRQYIDFKKSFNISENKDLIQNFMPKQIKVQTFISIDDDILELEKVEILVIPESFIYLSLITILCLLSIALFINKSRQNRKSKD